MTAGDYLRELRAVLERLDGAGLEPFQEALLRAREAGRRIFIIGNGGSAATASHLANDLNKGACVPGRPRFRALALTDSVPLLTAWANDAAYERVFVEQLANHLEPGDVVVAISGSGNSPNILAAAEWARRQGAVVLGLTGGDGGRLRPLADHCLVVPTGRMEQIEDVHLALTHALCVSLRARIAGGARVEGDTPAVLAPPAAFR